MLVRRDNDVGWTPDHYRRLLVLDDDEELGGRHVSRSILGGRDNFRGANGEEGARRRGAGRADDGAVVRGLEGDARATLADVVRYSDERGPLGRLDVAHL